MRNTIINLHAKFYVTHIAFSLRKTPLFKFVSGKTLDYNTDKK